MMKRPIGKRLAGLASLLALAACAHQEPAASGPVTLLGVPCSTPPALHCPDTACPGATTGAEGPAVDPGTGRKFFLDYPCDLRPGEKVTVVLNLHGGGSIGNWQRHYFPIMDYKERYRLVIATPTGPNGTWQSARDDQHLRNIVTQVETALGGRQNVKAFWLAGHSFGGQTSNRLINTDPFFQERLTGWVSLSGGRLGSKREDVRAAIPRGTPPPPTAAPPASGAAPAGAPPAGGLAADASILPSRPFSFIYETGEHELTAAGLPRDSKWAQQLGCRAQAAPREIRDTKAGYVFDGRAQTNRNPIWGLDPRPGTARIYDYPGCPNGRRVADIVRMDKGHTEGLEPAITEEIVRMMVAAR
jgi:hypothetical protein